MWQHTAENGLLCLLHKMALYNLSSCTLFAHLQPIFRARRRVKNVIIPLWSSSSVYLSLKEEDAGEEAEGKEMESGSDDVMTESYMTMAQSENCRLVDASIQKNISFDGKPMTPSGWNGGIGEIFSLRDQLKQAEEKASQVQREVRPRGSRPLLWSVGFSDDELHALCFGSGLVMIVFVLQPHDKSLRLDLFIQFNVKFEWVELLYSRSLSPWRKQMYPLLRITGLSNAWGGDYKNE